VLAAGTAVAGVATVALGLFAVDFGEQRVGIVALPDGAGASLRAQF
jgi:hypothetical protein